MSKNSFILRVNIIGSVYICLCKCCQISTFSDALFIMSCDMSCDLQEEIASRAEKFISKKTSLQGELETVHVCM